MGLAAVLELRPRAVLPPIWRELGPALRRDTPRAAAALAAAFNGAAARCSSSRASSLATPR